MTSKINDLLSESFLSKYLESLKSGAIFNCTEDELMSRAATVAFGAVSIGARRHRYLWLEMALRPSIPAICAIAREPIEGDQTTYKKTRALLVEACNHVLESYND